MKIVVIGCIWTKCYILFKTSDKFDSSYDFLLYEHSIVYFVAETINVRHNDEIKYLQQSNNLQINFTKI